MRVLEVDSDDEASGSGSDEDADMFSSDSDDDDKPQISLFVRAKQRAEAAARRATRAERRRSESRSEAQSEDGPNTDGSGGVDPVEESDLEAYEDYFVPLKLADFGYTDDQLLRNYPAIAAHPGKWVRVVPNFRFCYVDGELKIMARVPMCGST